MGARTSEIEDIHIHQLNYITIERGVCMIQTEIYEILKMIIGESADKLVLSTPPSQERGDFAFACFSLTSVLKKAPNDIAKDIANNLNVGKLKNSIIERAVAEGPYVNIFLKTNALAEKILSAVKKQKSNYGSQFSGKGKSVLIEHTSINPNADPHVGRARNAMIGDSLARIFKFEGYKTEVHYFVNDIGKQIAMLVLACSNKKITFKGLLNAYVKINADIKANPEKEKEVFALLNALESGDKKIRSKFKRVVDICIKGQRELFSDFGIEYDFFDYESKYLWSGATAKVLKKLEKTGRLFTDEKNRKVLDLKDLNIPMEPPLIVITRNDGTSLYVLRDIAYSMEKAQKGKDRNILLLGEDQKLYAQQMRATLSLINVPFAEVVHYTFVLLKGKGKMSTRRGDVVLLSEFMCEAKEEAKKEIAKRDKKVKDIDARAKAIAYGAIKYSFLKVSPEKNITFDWESSLSFEGDTGPYLQYAYARIASILRKNNDLPQKITANALSTSEEKALLLVIDSFPQVILTSITQLKPQHIATFAYHLAKTFTSFYQNCQVLTAETNELKNARLELCDATAQTLKNALNLLGIDVVEEM